MSGIILDTDIGTDIDDALALTYAIKRKLPLGLITTVHGPTRWRAKVARNICAYLGYEIPVIPGAEKAIKQPHVFIAGIEGTVDSNEPLIASDAIISALLESPKTIVAIGPLTNIALAIQKNPAIVAHIERLYVMGNAIICGDHYHINYRAHNFKADPEATDIVMAANCPKTLITTALCKEHRVAQNELPRLFEKYPYLEQGAAAWLKISGNEEVFLYDPFVVHHVIDDTATNRGVYGNATITLSNRIDFKKIFLDVMLNG